MSCPHDPLCMDDALVDSPLTLHITMQVGVKFCAGLRPTSQEAFVSWWAVGIAYQDPKLPTDCISIYLLPGSSISCL